MQVWIRDLPPKNTWKQYKRKFWRGLVESDNIFYYAWFLMNNNIPTKYII